jgi:hypothetical protein
MSSKRRCYYEVLEVSKSASEVEIKKSYRKLAVVFNEEIRLGDSFRCIIRTKTLAIPPRAASSRKSARLTVVIKDAGSVPNAAVLIDPSKRERYDRTGSVDDEDAVYSPGL